MVENVDKGIDFSDKLHLMTQVTEKFFLYVCHMIYFVY